MVLDNEEKIKKALAPQLMEYKVMQEFWNKKWDATQRYYEVEEGEQLRDLDILAQNQITYDGVFFNFHFRLEMYISVKYRQQFTFVGVKRPTKSSANKRVIEVLNPVYSHEYKGHSLIYSMPDSPTPFFDDTYDIYMQKDVKKPNFTNSIIFGQARELFNAWYSKTLYGDTKSWIEFSLDKMLNESWLKLFKDFFIKRLIEKRDEDRFLTFNDLGEIFLGEKLNEAMRIQKPTFYGVIRVPLLVVASESCYTLEYVSDTSPLENFKPMDWIKCNNYFFPLDKDQVRFGFYFMPLKNISQFIEEFEEYGQQWIQYFIKKEELYLKKWWSTLINTHIADYEHAFQQLMTMRNRV